MTHSAPVLSADEKRQRMVIATMRRNRYAPDALIETLHTVQRAFGYLDDTALRFVAGELSLLTTRCLGSCSLAPAAIMDENVVGNLTPERALAALEGVKSWSRV